ncbi:MAG: class I SAM-dependent methyltransferase [Gammaproteobacteria bacterium]|nr:class I SAM-dependent methyltransferase [Gammaproteobacteria bacterium]
MTDDQESGRFSAEDYEAWYRTARGSWIAEAEFSLMMSLMRPAAGASLLDVGSGTGHFSRRFAAAGLAVTGLDADAGMLAWARRAGGGVAYIQGTAAALPFASGSFDHVAAVTSLCFVAQPSGALAELWRVCRSGVLLGLLNRNSLLHRAKRGTGSYRGARWDTVADVRAWSLRLGLQPQLTVRSAVFVPGGGRAARVIEPVLPAVLPWGGFLAVMIRRDPGA